jgi:outer membrane lipoprotein SlyB
MHLSRLCQCALILAGITGCATQHPTSSTEGTTLVQAGYVTNVRNESPNGEPGGNSSTVTENDGAIAGRYTSSQHPFASAATVTEISVRFDDGHERWYRVAAGESFRVGERVKVTTHYGVSAVSHY